MERKAASVMVMLLLANILMLAFWLQPVNANRTIFYDDFNGTSLSSDWNYVYIAMGGDISISSGLLHIVASPLFQDDPMSAMVMRHWLTQIGDTLNISARLRINTFDRFALQVDHGKVNAYDDQAPMFGLVFRSAGTPTSAYIVAVGAGHGEWRGGTGIEGSLYSNLQNSQWYIGEIFIQRSPYLVTFSVKDDSGNVIAQSQIEGSDLISYTFDDIRSIGFNMWTSQRYEPYGNVDVDWIRISTMLPLVLDVKLSGGFDYSAKENVNVRLAAMVKNANTLEPVSDANVTIDIYFPNSTLWVSGKMVEKLIGTGIYEWESSKTIYQMKLKDGVYLAYVKASVDNGSVASDMLLFHIDPPLESEAFALTPLLYYAGAIIILIAGTIIGIALLRRNKR